MSAEHARTMSDDATLVWNEAADAVVAELDDPAVTEVETSPGADADVETEDPREDIEIGVLMANGRLAPRHFATWAEAEAWALPEEGERVVEYNILCECSFNS